MAASSKHVKTFKDFFYERKKHSTSAAHKNVDWESRKAQWLLAVDQLYRLVDELIVRNFQASGIQVSTRKEEVKIYEDYIGSYLTSNYIIEAEGIAIKFFPVGTIIIGAFGRVNMLLPNETVGLVLQNWNTWRIITGIGSAMKLVDFNEGQLVKLLQENI